ncbi:MAG: type I secretion protein, partial [Richelia sp. RM2_1_2]|nr:type I secretion protein [Richelia sp. RM2_1_2]
DQVFGGDGNDLVYGDKGDDFISGGSGNDQVFGGDGNDTLFGITPNSPLGLGQGEIDTLNGGRGKDTFVLAGAIFDGSEVIFYNDGDAESAGTDDYALITDFQNQDTIQLIGEAKDYILGAAPDGLSSGTGIFFNDGANPELIGIITDISLDDLSLDNPNQFSFV